MSTQAIIAFINLDSTVKYVDLVNDGDLAGKILAENYNSYNAAKLVTHGGVISALRPLFQNTMFHASNWGRPIQETNTDLKTLLAFSDVLTDDGCPVYVFDAREYKEDYEKLSYWHAHTNYGYDFDPHTWASDKQYWKRLTNTGELIPISTDENVMVCGEPGIGKSKVI